MKMTKRVFFVAVIFLVIVFALATIWAVKNLSLPKNIAAGQNPNGETTVLAQVKAITDQGMITLGNNPQLYQGMDVQVLQGDYTGQHFSVTYGKDQIRADSTLFKAGDKVYIMIGQGVNGTLRATYIDYDRSGILILLLVVFILAVLSIGRWKGLGSLVSLGISMFIIFTYIIPHILAGEDPVRVSLIG